MNAFRPIYRELAILYFRWARKDLRCKPTDPDLPYVITRLSDLIAERPHQLKVGKCCESHRCYEGRDCPLRRLHHHDGGHRVDGTRAIRLEHCEIPSNRALLGAVGAGLIVLAAALMQAAGITVTLIF